MSTLDTVLDGCRAALSSIDDGDRETLIESILRSRKVFVYGSGRSGLVGQLFAVRLVQLGLDVHFVGEMTTPIIGKDDLTILISNTGRTSSVVQTARIAHRIGSRIISITGDPDSDLAGASDVCISLDVPRSEELQRAAPLGTVFEDATLLFFDCIVSDIMRAESISEEEMRNRHAIWV